MPRIWAALAATVSVMAVFAVLAIAQLPIQSAPAAQPARVVMARSANGTLVPVPLASTSTGSIHATTQTSPTASAASTSSSGQPVTYVKTASGLGSAVTPSQPTTRTS